MPDEDLEMGVRIREFCVKQTFGGYGCWSGR